MRRWTLLSAAPLLCFISSLPAPSTADEPSPSANVPPAATESEGDSGTLREYRIPGARYTLDQEVLRVQYRSGKGVFLALDGEPEPRPYVNDEAVTIVVDDGSGGTPTIDGSWPPAADDFGDVLTTLEFRGNVRAFFDGQVMVVIAGGDPSIQAQGGLPATASDLAAADVLEWSSEDSGDPHPPV